MLGWWRWAWYTVVPKGGRRGGSHPYSCCDVRVRTKCDSSRVAGVDVSVSRCGAGDPGSLASKLRSNCDSVWFNITDETRSHESDGSCARVKTNQISSGAGFCVAHIILHRSTRIGCVVSRTEWRRRSGTCKDVLSASQISDTQCDPRGRRAVHCHTTRPSVNSTDLVHFISRGGSLELESHNIVASQSGVRTGPCATA